MIHICSSHASEGQCGTCEHFGLVGVSMGICLVDEDAQYLKDVMAQDDCDCGKWKDGKSEKLL